MSKKEKLKMRLLSYPKDFTFSELVSLLGHFGFRIVKTGKTGGSRVAFTDGKGDYIRIYNPIQIA